MSTGLVCLTCRKYLTPGARDDMKCKCKVPEPSHDARTPIGRRCRICNEPSPLLTLCDRCDLSSNLYGGSAVPWPEVRDFVLNE
jgi:hypothetical protein